MARPKGVCAEVHGHACRASRAQGYHSWIAMKSRCQTPQDPAWSETAAVGREGLRARLLRGLDPEVALTAPSREVQR